MHISGQVLLNVLANLEPDGIEPTALLERLSFLRSDLERPFARAPWSEAALVFERLGARLVDARLVELGRRHTRSYPGNRVLASLVHAPRALLELMLRTWAPLSPFLELASSEDEQGRVVVRLHLRDDEAPSRAFFVWTTGTLAATPRLLGLSEAEVEAQLEPRRGTYAIRLPRARAGTVRASTLSRLPIDATLADLIPALEQLAGVRSGGLELDPEIDRLPTEVELLHREHGVSPSEARVMQLLAEGMSPSEIAGRMGIAVETARSHLKRCYAKTGTKRQAELARLLLRWRQGHGPAPRAPRPSGSATG